MPQYFFHVSLELFPDRKTQPAPRQLLPQHPTPSHALEPFLPSKRRKTSKTFHSESHQTRRSPDTASAGTHFHGATIAEQIVPSSPDDSRLDDIYVEGTDMTSPREALMSQNQQLAKDGQINKGIGTSISGPQTKGRYIPFEKDTTSVGWGIVHLYRDVDETSGLYTKKPPDLWDDGGQLKKPAGKPHRPPDDEECTTLCILAVPSYLAPADFLAFVGEETRNEVSHFRMIRTSRANRYMVLMKFRNGRRARDWQFEWNGKVFNSMEPETCHVVFLKSVEVIQPSMDSLSDPNGNNESYTTTTYPSIAHDPFSSSSVHPPTASANSNASSKPFPPPTPSLLELPTCPVCLERMDETTGLLTILCQHVFHCTCLQKWSGGGCPVCRYTHDDFSTGKAGKKSKKTKYKTKNMLSGEYEPYYDPDNDDGLLECEDEGCSVHASLWQCLICGRVGCGRYEGKHAFKHYEISGHSFAMDLDSKRVWDYGGDGYVHRILQDQKDAEKEGRDSGRVVGTEDWEYENEDGGKEDAGREALALEYTHLLTSQLESQRVYFEAVVERAVDKASQAAKEAERAGEAARQSQRECENLRRKVVDVERNRLEEDKEMARLERKNKKFEELSREVRKQVEEERSVNRNLMERVKHLDAQVTTLSEEKTELEEMVRDLTFSISATEKIREMEEEGKGKGLLEEGELQEGTVSVPEGEKKGKGKKGKGRR